EAFKTGAVGKGIGIIPESGVLYAPCDGEIVSIAKTKHAVAIKSEFGAEVLIHIGIDTVKLNGKYFKAFKGDNNKIKTGDKLIEFDMEEIKKAGYDITSVVLICNHEEYDKISPTEKDKVKKGDLLIDII
ncbi:MAG: PTS glucose transporter subunit IIA, partial [Clostridia bacterium]|nr:PTS glucose transporter subunit IIA [Clostridia bacterium]